LIVRQADALVAVEEMLEQVRDGRLAVRAGDADHFMSRSGNL